MRHQHLSLALVLCFAIGPVRASSQNFNASADTLNRMDEQGRKQGYWQVVAPVAERAQYKPGQLFEEGRYLDNRRNGPWKRYWPNGKLLSQIVYDRGRPKGDYTTYYENGQVEEQGTWELDRNTGDFSRWHANGKVAQDFQFDANGTRQGQQQYYYENGQKAVEVNVVNGQEAGTLKRWHANGDVQQVAQFEGGEVKTGTGKIVQATRKPVVADPLPASAAPAPAVRVDEKPNAAKKFDANGHNTLYDLQMRLSQVGDFRNGRLWTGKYYRYDATGKLVKLQRFEGGKYVGDMPIMEDELQ
jgi:antitoxin component YwqK of YwqJK toxin-antitoxin module